MNAGESWVTSSVDDWKGDTAGTASNGSWTDWSLVCALLTEANKTVVYDNQPIKAYAQAQDWASVDELSQLEEAIAKAKALLGTVKISADGTDVAAGEQWMTQADYDALKAEVDEAEAVLAKAGADYKTTVVLATPSSDDVNEQLANLSVFEAEVSAAAKAGTKQASTTPASSSSASGAAKKRSYIPGTGDVAGLVPAAPALAGSALLALRRRLRR